MNPPPSRCLGAVNTLTGFLQKRSVRDQRERGAPDDQPRDIIGERRIDRRDGCGHHHQRQQRQQTHL